MSFPVHRRLTLAPIGVLIVTRRANGSTMRSYRYWGVTFVSFVPVLCIAAGMNIHCVHFEDDSGGTGGAKTWDKPVRLHDKGTSPDVAVDATGNAVATWVEPTNDGIWASRSEANGAWNAPQLINRAGDVLGTVSAALDPAGNVLVVWPQYYLRNNVFTNRQSSGSNWGLSHRLDNDTGSVSEPDVAMGADGTGIAVWVQDQGTHQDVWACRFTRSGGWGDPQTIEINNATKASGPKVAIDPSGNAVTVWTQLDGLAFDIWSNRYTPSGQWGGADRIESNDFGEARQPDVGTDAEGNAVAVWSQSDGVTFDIWASRFASGSGSWSAPVRIEGEDEGDAANPDVAVASDGIAVAVWTQSDSDREHIWANRYTPADGWGVAVQIESAEAGPSGPPRVAIDPSGFAVAVWQRIEGAGDSIWANQLSPKGVWGPAQRADRSDGVDLGNPRVAMDAGGNAVAVWAASGGAGTGIWSSRME